MKRCMLILLGCLAYFPFLFSQNIDIRGNILDDEKNILAGASVAIYKQDSVLVTGALSDAKGFFEIKGLASESYNVVISFIGFSLENIQIPNLKKDIDLGAIALSLNTELEEVVVTTSSKHYGISRQILIPTKPIIDISNNAWSLMKNMQLSRIQFNPITNEITTDDGEHVILQINGVQAAKEEVMALKSTEIIRVEYSDQPSVRYQAGAVINYVVKRREQGGHIMLSGNQNVSSIGMKQYSFSGNYNWKKSQLGVVLGYNQARVKWTRDNEYHYNFPEEEFTRTEKGEPALYNDKTWNASVKYTLSDPDKYLFSATFRNKLNDVPNQFSDRQGYATNSNSDVVSFFQDFSERKENIPSLDLYYHRNLKNKQLLIFNMVGTLTDTKSQHTYKEVLESDNSTIADIYSLIDGKKYSIIAEAIYEKKFENNSKLNVGLRHNQSRTENEYMGDINSNVNLDYSESYIFADYTLQKGGFGLNTGLSGKYTYYKQDGETYKQLNPQPRLQLQYSFKNEMTLRYYLNVSSASPSLSDLNDVEQEINMWQIRRGNSSLKNSMNYNQSLMYIFNSKYIGIELMGAYSYTNNPINETIFVENDKIVNSVDNQKKSQRIRVQSTFNIRPFGQYISLQVRPRFSRYMIHGNSYTHTYNNWSVNANLLASYKRWFLNAQMETRNNILTGETITYGQNFHMVGMGYNADKWNVSTGLFLPFSKDYSQATKNLSKVAASYSKVHSRDFQALVYIAASINLDFGKAKKKQRQRTNNQDSGSGILQTGKISM